MNKTDVIGAGVAGGFREKIKPQRFQYGDGTGAGAVDTGTDALIVGSVGFDPVYGYNLTTNPLGIDVVTFALNGGQVSIVLTDTSGPTSYNLVTYNLERNKAQNLKVVNQNCRALLPTLQINNRLTPGATPYQELAIQEFQGCSGNFPNYDFLSDNDSQNDWYNKAYTADPSQVLACIALDKERLCWDYGTATDLPTSFAYPGLTLGDWTDQSHVLCVKPGVVYGGNLNIATRGANTSNYLGFPSVSHVVLPQVGGSSFSPPALTSSKSIFVRLENFGQESVNSFQGLRSKIIAHLPRFDGLNAVGPLYLEPNNLIYLDLKNPNEMKMNSFDISLCYADETLAESLVGTTIVCLHIKQK